MFLLGPPSISEAGLADPCLPSRPLRSGSLALRVTWRHRESWTCQDGLSLDGIQTRCPVVVERPFQRGVGGSLVGLGEGGEKRGHPDAVCGRQLGEVPGDVQSDGNPVDLLTGWSGRETEGKGEMKHPGKWLAGVSEEKTGKQEDSQLNGRHVDCEGLGGHPEKKARGRLGLAR